MTYSNANRSTAHLTRKQFMLAAATCATASLVALPALALADQAGDTPPEKPSGDAGNGEPPSGDKPGGEPPSGGQPGGQGGPGGADTMNFDYTGTYTGAFTADGTSQESSGVSIEATDADQNAVLAQNAGTATVSDCSITKSGDDTDGDRCNFYGANSIALAVNEGSTVVLDGCTMSATSEGSNAVFATDSAVAYVNNCTIQTEAGNSRGLDATYAGVVVASQVDITTNGQHCAACATDRGGGTISIVDSTLSTAGSGSPLLYSTGNIQAHNVTGTAAGSQIAGMEGLNTILVDNCTLESTNTGLTGSDPVANGVIIYQSTSGDAESTTGETATFQAVNSTLKSAITSGAMFYFTNTAADVLVCNSELDFDSSAARLAYVAGNDANSWGTPGSNGATVNFTARNQEVSGDVCADTVSTLNMYVVNGSTWEGAASIEDNANGSTSTAPLTVSVDANSTWTVTADSHVSALNVAAGGVVQDASGNTVTIVAGGSTAVSGSGSITVTVDGAYTTDDATSSAAQVASDVYDRSAFDAQFGTTTTWAMGNTAD